MFILFKETIVKCSQPARLHLAHSKGPLVPTCPAITGSHWTTCLPAAQNSGRALFKPANLKIDFHFKEKVLITNARNGIVDKRHARFCSYKKSFLIELNWTWTENENWIRLMQVPVDRNGLAEWVWRSGSQDWQQWIIAAMDDEAEL